MKTVRLVSQLPEDLAFVSDDIGVKTVKKHLGIEKYDCFFIRIKDGGYDEVWGMDGIIPYIHKLVDKIV